MESARMTPELQGLKEAIILRGPGYVVMIMGKKSALTFQDLFWQVIDPNIKASHNIGPKF